MMDWQETLDPDGDREICANYFVNIKSCIIKNFIALAIILKVLFLGTGI